jgi:prolipoprotein diacylglyceryl transferase
VFAETLQPRFEPTRALRERLNALFDRLIRLRVRFLGRDESTFLVCGKIGLVLAIALGIVLTRFRGLSLEIILVLSGVSVAALLLQSLIMKVLTGEEQLVYYRHEVAILITVAITLWVSGQPLWPYLDITILAIGVLLACGRIGCLMVGCCHGRPSPIGPRYTPDHAAAGFTDYYVGIRLFPIQLLESAWVSGTVLVGIGIVLSGAAPGEAFAWYVVVYDVGRFTFEFVRGDPDRPFIAGFTEAQWTSVLLMLVVVGAEAAGVLPFHAWHSMATVALVVAMVVLHRSRAAPGLSRRLLLHPRHVREVAVALQGAERDRSGLPVEGMPVFVVTTSLGVQLSAGTTSAGSVPVRHYTVSSSRGPLAPEAIRTVGELIQQLKRMPAAPQMIQGPTGAVHLLFASPENTDS